MGISTENVKVVLLIEYDGKNYSGFQYQLNAPTIQKELEWAIKRLTREDRRISAASRTDAGVHAKGQVVSFITSTSYPCDVFVNGLNHYLPDDIAVKQALKAGKNFNVRSAAISREYRYSILNSSIRSPLKRSHHYLVRQHLEVESMRYAAQRLCGKHDFASFTSKMANGKTVRTVYDAVVSKKNSEVFFNITANSFLPHQVRNTVGALMQIGLGNWGTDHINMLLDAKSPDMAGPRVPANGLCLMKVNYPQPLGAM